MVIGNISSHPRHTIFFFKCPLGCHALPIVWSFVKPSEHARIIWEWDQNVFRHQVQIFYTRLQNAHFQGYWSNLICENPICVNVAAGVKCIFAVYEPWKVSLRHTSGKASRIFSALHTYEIRLRKGGSYVQASFTLTTLRLPSHGEAYSCKSFECTSVFFSQY